MEIMELIKICSRPNNLVSYREKHSANIPFVKHCFVDVKTVIASRLLCIRFQHAEEINKIIGTPLSSYLPRGSFGEFLSTY